MPMRIPGKRLDERIDKILRDPKGYFDEARRAARAEVTAERSRQRNRLRRRPT